MQEIGLDGIGRAQRVGQRLRAAQAAVIHRAVEVLAEDRQPGTGAADGFAGADVGVQRLGHRRAFPVADIAGLVAAGDENAVGPDQAGQDLRGVRGCAVLEHEGLDRQDAANLLVELLAQFIALRGAQHHQMAIAGLLHEPAHDVDIAVAAAHQQQAGADRTGRGRIAVADHEMAVVGGCRRRNEGHEQQQRHDQRECARHVPASRAIHERPPQLKGRQRAGAPHTSFEHM